MAFNTGQFGIQYDTDDHRPMWPWFVVFCCVVAVLGLILAGMWKMGRKTVQPQTEEHAVEKRETAPVRGRSGGVATSAPQTQVPTREEERLSVLPESLRAQFAAAEHATKESFFQEARGRWLALLQEPLLPENLRAGIEEQLTAVTMPLLTTSAPMPGKTNYLIKPGDALSKIARRYGMTQEMLMRINNIADPSRIVAGRSLVVIDKPDFSLRVNRASGEVTLLLDKGFVKRWPAQPGRGDATPVGEFSIGNKIERPSWWLVDGTEVPYGHAENVLGSRWMSLLPLGKTHAVGSIGLHGSNDRNNTQRGAGGSIRMRNADIEELYWMIPGGTLVSIE